MCETGHFENKHSAVIISSVSTAAESMLPKRPVFEALFFLLKLFLSQYIVFRNQTIFYNKMFGTQYKFAK